LPAPRKVMVKNVRMNQSSIEFRWASRRRESLKVIQVSLGKFADRGSASRSGFSRAGGLEQTGETCGLLAARLRAAILTDTIWNAP